MPAIVPRIPFAMTPAFSLKQVRFRGERRFRSEVMAMSDQTTLGTVVEPTHENELRQAKEQTLRRGNGATVRRIRGSQAAA
jgi:hypothetical protein